MTLTIDLNNRLLGSAHCLVALIISTYLFQNIFACVEVTFQTQKLQCFCHDLDL